MTNLQVRRAGFTMVELMTVMAIIVILITILIPVVSKVRTSANTAAVKAEIMSIEAAVDRYQQTFGAYPGPISDDNIGINPVAPLPAIKNITDATFKHVTGSENLVLGLLGGLTMNGAVMTYDAGLVGKGPQSLTALNPKAYPAFIDGVPLTVKNGYNTADPGHYRDGAGIADDSEVPEFLDRYSNPMPILYLRARTGASGVVSIGGQDSNGWVVGPNIQTQYDLSQILGYTQGKSGSIGEGKSIKPSQYKPTAPPSSSDLPHGLRSVSDIATLEKGPNYVYPYNAFPYFVDRNSPPTDTAKPNATGQPKEKDKYILISAGPDRVYGTADDVTNFGDVAQ